VHLVFCVGLLCKLDRGHSAKRHSHYESTLNMASVTGTGTDNFVSVKKGFQMN